ncbi:PREDICTED: coiled-coil domain-containing protein 22 isoform X2 [Nicotiana attenuata]|uniref:coiled-coil domain-containing protein 22 isoform X2 n=1 Tax=Nicotiana attenuata TaxID=49451 RepID=UPI000904675A|nr:PREDICTED: coiled-coil domain-containing protein 22 isoform X2 [Nicotiana attenuata]
MEKSQEILLNSIANSGVTIPPGISSVKDLTPETLFFISSQSLHLIDQNSSFTSSLPENSVSDRLKLCSDLASAFKTLGFVGDISFHKFLYPSEEDLYELVRFLAGRLSDVEARKDAVSESKRSLKTPEENVDDTGPLPHKELLGRVGDPLMMTETPESSQRSYLTTNKMDEFYNGVHIPGEGRVDSSEEISGGEQDVLDMVEGVRSSLRENEHDSEYGLQSTSPCVNLPQMNCKTETLQDQKEMLVEKSVSGNDKRKALEQEKSYLEETLKATEPESYLKYKKLEEIELELEFILAEKKKREDELIILSAKAEKRPELEPRSTYIQRIEEITKNSRKQDADIERILKATRELQLESNSIQERLNRTHAVVDEMVFREAKKDQVGRQAYRILTSIHDSFEQIAENLLATDRARREVADYEGKLATMASRTVDIDKLKADLDTIRRENDLLEARLSENLSKDSSQSVG